MFYPDELIEEVRARTDIVSVISQYVKLIKKGSGYMACCPFHNEKTPSFHVSPSRQYYHCFGCGVGGNVFTFMMQYENCTFPEALKILADRAGISLPEREATQEEKERASLRQILLAVNKEAATYFYFQLRSPQGVRAAEYFRKRGLSEETVRKFGLGYSQNYRDDLYRYLKKKGFDDASIVRSGLAKITEKGVQELFWNRAMFPIMDAGGHVIAFGGRVMGEGEPKYLNSPETMLFDKSRSLFGLHLARRSRRPYFILCEGYMDVISMHQAGFDCALASLGTSLTEGHVAILRRFTKEIILSYDSDGAGKKAAMRAIPLLQNAGLSVRVLNLKPYKDPDEFLTHEGTEMFEARIREAENAFLFQSDVVREGFDLGDPEQKTRFHREIARMLLAFPDELERTNYLEAVSRRHGIPEQALVSMVRSLSLLLPENETERRRPARTARRAEEYGSGYSGVTEGAGLDVPDEPLRRPVRSSGLAEDERLVLGWAVSEAGHPERLIEYLEPEDFLDAACRMMAEALFPAWKEGRSLEPASLINACADDPAAAAGISDILDRKLPEDLTPEDAGRILSESVRRIRKEGLKRRLTDPGHAGEILTVQNELGKIDKKVIRL